MEIEKLEKENVVLLLPKGNLVYHGVEKLDTFMNTLYEDARNIILDLKYTNYISANALGMIASYVKLFRDTQKVFKLINVNESIKKLMDITGLLRIVEVFNSEYEAVSSISPRVGKLEKMFLWSKEERY